MGRRREEGRRGGGRGDGYETLSECWDYYYSCYYYYYYYYYYCCYYYYFTTTTTTTLATTPTTTTTTTTITTTTDIPPPSNTTTTTTTTTIWLDVLCQPDICLLITRHYEASLRWEHPIKEEEIGGGERCEEEGR